MGPLFLCGQQGQGAWEGCSLLESTTSLSSAAFLWPWCPRFPHCPTSFLGLSLFLTFSLSHITIKPFKPNSQSCKHLRCTAHAAEFSAIQFLLHAFKSEAVLPKSILRLSRLEAQGLEPRPVNTTAIPGWGCSFFTSRVGVLRGFPATQVKPLVNMASVSPHVIL